MANIDKYSNKLKMNKQKENIIIQKISIKKMKHLLKKYEYYFYNSKDKKKPDGHFQDSIGLFSLR